MVDRHAIGVDMGGTKIAFALVDETGNVLASHRLPTLPEEGAEAVFDRIAEGIHYIFDQSPHAVTGIGIGCPGHLNPFTGIVYNATNLRWHDVPLKAGVEARLRTKLPIFIQQDANAAAVGEMYFGAAQNCPDFVYLAIGTGLGGAAVVSGKLLLGGDFAGMEVGHMPLSSNGRLCACGMRGCPEMYVSGIGLLAGVREHAPAFPASPLVALSEQTTVAILDAARKGDSLALAVFDEMTDWLCAVMICCMGILNPLLFVVGGGMGHAAADLILPATRRKLAARTAAGIYQHIEIVESQITSSAVGASCLVWSGLTAQEEIT